MQTQYGYQVDDLTSGKVTSFATLSIRTTRREYCTMADAMQRAEPETHAEFRILKKRWQSLAGSLRAEQVRAP